MVEGGGRAPGRRPGGAETTVVLNVNVLLAVEGWDELRRYGAQGLDAVKTMTGDGWPFPGWVWVREVCAGAHWMRGRIG